MIKEFSLEIGKLTQLGTLYPPKMNIDNITGEVFRLAQLQWLSNGDYYNLDHGSCSSERLL